MNFKLDENLSHVFVELFEKSGHHADTIGDENLSGSHDEAVFDACRRENRTLVTLDLDFANPIRFKPGEDCGIMVLRPASPTLSQIRGLLVSGLRAIAETRLSGRLWIVEHGRIRVHEPDPGE